MIMGQPQEAVDLLKIIQKNATSVNKEKNFNMEKKFARAKSLERSGLYEEAFSLFKEINLEKPGINKYFQPMKNYLKQMEAWDTLMVYTQKYANARNQDFQSQLEFLDIFIWMDAESRWQETAFKLTQTRITNDNSMKSLMQHLVNNGKYDFAYERLKEYRQKTNTKDFYSIEMGTFFGIRMDYEKAVQEYLLFLETHPEQLQTISDRIMVYPDIPDIMDAITSILLKSPLQSSQFILADLLFKQKSYKEGYEILKSNEAPPLMLLNYAEDLISVNEYMKAEKVLTDIINSDVNEQMATKAVIEMAKIFETKMIITSLDLPLSGFYPHNPFFSSPYLPVKEEAGTALAHAMDIYDSLRVTKKNAQAAYRLAEVQFRVLGDLDGAFYLYQEAQRHGNSKNLRLDAGIGMINIQIAKGDLEEAGRICAELKKQTPAALEYDVKSAQVLFYEGQFEAADSKLKEIVENIPEDQTIYNDILNVIAVLIGFRHNQEEFKKFANIQLNIQQNKRTEAMEKLETLYDTNEIYIADMCRYQHAWLSFLQDETETAKIQLQTILHETIFKELAHIFQAEILDYIDKDVSRAIDSYLEFLERYPNSIYYDDVRLRLRELAS